LGNTFILTLAEAGNRKWMSAVRGGTVQSPARSADDFPFSAVGLVQSVYFC